MKIGIYAGTFDPVHSGHLDFAITAIKECDLEKVVVIAEKKPYRKQPHTSWDHRQAMIERATSEISGVDHDYAFASLLAHQHTMKDMLATAEKHYGFNNKFWFLVGSDMFEHMHQWRDIIKNHQYEGFIVALRDDHTEEWLTEKRMQMHESGFNPEVVIIDSPRPHVSSSNIRTEIMENRKPTQVTESVYGYIASHKLYK